MQKRFYKDVDDTRVWFSGVLKVNGKQVFNPTEDMLLADGWLEYIPPVAPEPTAEELLARAKERKIREIEAHDDSKAVNNCYVVYGGKAMPYWADKFERDSLKGTIADFIALGREYYRLDLRDVNVSITVECVKLQAMMRVLEAYAADCFNKTTDHIFAVRGLSTVEDVEAYDYTIGYPEKPTFEF